MSFTLDHIRGLTNIFGSPCCICFSNEHFKKRYHWLVACVICNTHNSFIHLPSSPSSSFLTYSTTFTSLIGTLGQSVYAQHSNHFLPLSRSFHAIQLFQTLLFLRLLRLSLIPRLLYSPLGHWHPISSYPNIQSFLTTLHSFHVLSMPIIPVFKSLLHVFLVLFMFLLLCVFQ